MKKLYYLIISVFVTPLIVLGLLSVTDVDKTISESENRMLATKPKFSLAALFGSDYIEKLDNYYNDTFPLRESLLSANTKLNRLYYFSLGLDDDDVALVLDYNKDQLSEGGEALTDTGTEQDSTSEDTSSITPTDSTPTPSAQPSQEPTPTPTPDLPPDIDVPDEADFKNGSIVIVGDRAMEIAYKSDKALSAYASAINRISERLPNVRVINLVAPTAGEFYSPEEYHTGETSQSAMIDYVYSALSDSVISIDAYSQLRQHTDDYIYFRTDHHWTQLGAYYAYTAFCKALDLSCTSLDSYTTGSIENFVGSMYTFTKSYPQSAVLKNNPDTLYYYKPAAECTVTAYSDSTMSDGWSLPLISSSVNSSNKYLAFLSGDHALAKVETPLKNGKKIVILKESYGNAFIPFLVDHYEEIYVVDPRKFNGKDKPSFDLIDFCTDKEIDDLIVFNYSLMAGNINYPSMLLKLIGE